MPTFPTPLTIFLFIGLLKPGAPAAGARRRIALFCFCFFFFNDTATTEIYTLSLHDALPICDWRIAPPRGIAGTVKLHIAQRSEEHTSELQSLRHLVCRLLLEKKKQNKRTALLTRQSARAVLVETISASLLVPPVGARETSFARPSHVCSLFFFFFFLNNRAPPKIYPFPLPAAFPI